MVDSAFIVGMAAGTLVTVSFLPQVIKVWKTKSAKDISLGMYLLFITGVILWLVWGIMIQQVPAIIANVVTLLLSSTVLVFKLRYG